MSIAIESFADSHHDDVYEICRAAWAVDVPDIPYSSPAMFAATLLRSPPATAFERYVAVLDGATAGFLQLRLPQADNLGNVELDLLTAPDSRRCGVGRALWACAVERTHALGRKHLIGATTDHRSDGGAFAVAMGASAGLPETRSRLQVPPPDQERLDALLADSWRHADGYRLVQWTGVPPEEFLDDVAYLDSRMNADAPMGDLAMEPEKVDAARVRANAERQITVGRTVFHTGVVHPASGRMIAWTVLAGDDDTPVHAWQNITIVDPDHRGRRLGMIVKLENLRYTLGLRPELAWIDTFNASANRHMLAINETMGFRRVDSWMQWQRTL
jgi:GNAT superfamily N-acetyltransferase